MSKYQLLSILSNKASVLGSNLPKQETETLNTDMTCFRGIFVNKMPFAKLFL